MALFRATSNPQATLKLEAASRRLDKPTSAPRPAVKSAAPLELRRGSIREAVINVIASSDEELSPRLIHREAAKALGTPVRRHTIDTALSKLVADPSSAIAKVGRGLYSSSSNEAPQAPSPQTKMLQGQVRDVLQTAGSAMRTAEIWAAVDARLDEPISYDGVAVVLSNLAKQSSGGVRRVKPGWYSHA
jgi:hypothetical protein